MSNATPSVRRWFPQFSLRLLLIATALCGVLLVFVRQRTESQHHAFQKLTAKGFVFYGPNSPSSQPWLDRLYHGDKRYDAISSAFAKNGKISPADTSSLLAFPQLDSVGFKSTPVRGLLPSIAKLPELRILHIEDARITASDFDDLRGTHLFWLALTRVELEPVDLSSFPDLQYLELVGPFANDELLKGVAKLSKLELLYLYDTRITDAGLAKLAHLPALCNLWLSKTPINGSCFQEFADSDVTNLQLNDTNVDSSAVDHLIGMRKLKSLELKGTKLAKEDRAKLKRARPDITQTFDPLLEHESQPGD
ncbi:hypothetical protein [Anatilimnocola floriformis]|uniref:hypothetical protein n=1 Tax=Anatilimnocola floriformis TaxID=2948575 RepID=UPI0020C23CAB|nr:hypothetical protein [Anatilimnocola floriformis]